MNMDICHHCQETEVPSYDTNISVRWCARCVQEDMQLLNDVGLVNDSGQPLVLTHGWGEAYFEKPSNVKKILALPKRGQTPQVIHIDLVATEEDKKGLPPPNQPQLDNDWFERYNSLDSLPGRRT